MPDVVLQAKNLTKKYGDFAVVRGINLDILQGEVFGLLGPNGAGKSTTISMMTCLFPPTDGSILIYGKDAVRQPEIVKPWLGIVPQDLALYPTLSARDNLRFFGEMYGLKGKELKSRVDMVLDYVNMSERANDPIRTYSGGMKRRINLAVGLIHSPKILFLDEPTVGVDPQSRNHIFESVERLNQEQGMTIIYTTHYMEEAERLCQRIAIIDHGNIIAQDTPKNLIGILGGGIIQIGIQQENEEILRAVMGLSQVKNAVFSPPDEAETAPSRSLLKVEARQADEALVQIIQLFREKGIEMISIKTLEPNLESVFLHLTGKSLRQ